MAGDENGFRERLLAAGTRLVARAAEKVLTDPRGQEALARAVGMAQRGRRRVEELQERVMQAAGIPGRQDYQDLAKQLARIKRQARELSERLEGGRQGREAEAPGPGGGGGSAGDGGGRSSG
jgi:hypothetical protein